MHRSTRACSIALALTLGGIAGGPVLARSAETFTATATVKSPDGNASTAVRIGVDRYATDAERDRLLTVVKGGDQGAIREALASMPDAGYIQIGTRRTTLKYAYARPSGGGRLITVIAAAPIAFVGAAAPDAKPRDGFDLALALLMLDDHDTGDGELAPAAKVKANAEGAIVTEEYGQAVVHLTSISKNK
jgi:hypothetical protein